MNKFFLGVIILMLIFLLIVFFFVTQTTSRIGKGAKEMRGELERVQAPFYTPMGIFTAFMKLFLSFFP